jgi:hypothetical protein
MITIIIWSRYEVGLENGERKGLNDENLIENG